jgi:signal transduction histidine kinase
MDLRKSLPLALLCVRLLCAAGVFAEGRSAAPPDAIREVMEQWFEIELLFSRWTDGADTGPLLEKLSAFSTRAAAFLDEPFFFRAVHSLYPLAGTVQNIADRARSLTDAVRNNDRSAAERFAVGVRKELISLYTVLTSLAGAISMRYFYLFGFLIVILCFSAFTIWRLLIAFRSSLFQEQYTGAFSRIILQAQEEERSRIARELHDSVAQDMRLMGLQLARVAGGTLPEKADGLIREISQEQKTLLTRVRDICGNLLSPGFNGDSGDELIEALKRLCGEFSAQHNIPCGFTAREAIPAFSFLAEKKIQCYRIVQEALANIAKHSGAKEAGVMVRFAGTGKNPRLLIFVSDDGKGFSNPPANENYRDFMTSSPQGTAAHIGIRGMFERCFIIGGSLKFTSEPGEGTMIKIEVPCTPIHAPRAVL